MRLFYIVSDKFELTNVHEPQHFRVDNPQGTTYTPDQISTVCSSPPTGYQNYIVFSTPPFWGFSCHNTSYLVKASYSYTKVTGPPPTYQRIGPIEVSIMVNFNNLTVEAEPEYLINNPGGDNHNTTITFQLKSAQKKLCSATISIYTSTQQLVKQETLNNLLCPGSYTYTWDGKGNQVPSTNKIPGAGVYLYDILVQGASPYDKDTRCSTYLKIKQTKFELVGGIDDPFPNYEDSSIPLIHPKVSYLMEDSIGRYAYSAKITVFDKNKKFVTEEPSEGLITNLPDATDPIWNTKVLEFDIGSNLHRHPFTFLVSAIDEHRDSDKAHRRKPALQRNTVSQLRRNYRVVIDVGHYYDYTKYPEGSTGTKYCKPPSECNIERYLQYEYCYNYCISEHLLQCLDRHNQICLHHHYLVERISPTQEELKLIGDEAKKDKRLRLRAKHVAEVTKGSKNNPPAKIFLSIHCDGLVYPYSTGTSNFAANLEQQTSSEYGRYDKDLADSLVAYLRNLPKIELPKDENLKGDCSEAIRSQPVQYSPPYKGSERHSYAVLRALKAPTSGSLLETVTLTNYNDEDYISSGVDYIARSIRGAFNGFVFMHPEELE